MNRQHHISLRDEFDEHDCDGTKYIVMLDDGYPVATCRFYAVDSTIVVIGRLVVLPDYRGQGLGIRTIPISDGVINELKSYKKVQDKQIKKMGELYEGKPGKEARLFTTYTGKPIYDSTLRDWLNKFLDWCDVPRVTVHGLRHTFASILTADGVDPRTTAALLGQSSPALVMNVYANPQSEAKKRAIKTLDKHFKTEENNNYSTND